MGKNLAYSFTNLCSVYTSLQRIHYTIHKTTRKRANNVLEIRAYIKGRSQLSIKPVDSHREVCNIYGEDQMSYRTICRWVAKFRRWHQQLKDVAHTELQQQQLKVTQKKIPNIIQCPIHSEAISPVNKLVASTSSQHFKEAFTTQENRCKMGTPFVEG